MWLASELTEWCQILLVHLNMIDTTIIRSPSERCLNTSSVDFWQEQSKSESSALRRNCSVCPPDIISGFHFTSTALIFKKEINSQMLKKKGSGEFKHHHLTGNAIYQKTPRCTVAARAAQSAGPDCSTQPRGGSLGSESSDLFSSIDFGWRRRRRRGKIIS